MTLVEPTANAGTTAAPAHTRARNRYPTARSLKPSEFRFPGVALRKRRKAAGRAELGRHAEEFCDLRRTCAFEVGKTQLVVLRRVVGPQG